MGDVAESRLAAYIQPLPVRNLVLSSVLWDFHNGQPSTERAGGGKRHNVIFVSSVHIIPYVVDKLDLVLTFCGISDAVLSPHLYVGSLSS